MIEMDWSAIAVSWLLTYALHSTLLLGVAWLLSRQRLVEPYRLAEKLWKAALVGALFTATAQVVVGFPPLAGRFDVSWLALPQTFTKSVVASAMPTKNPQPVRFFVSADESPAQWPPWLLIVWISGASIGLARIVMTRRRLRQVLRQTQRRTVPAGPMRLTLLRLCKRAKLAYPVRLTYSSQILVPMALEGNEICIPKRALTDLSCAQQESMLAHELAHIVRRDANWRLAAQVIQAIFFFQPLNRLASSKLQDLAECLCDDWAVRQTGGDLSLAQCLAEVATWVSQRSQFVAVPGLTGKPSLLVTRVTRLVDTPPRRDLSDFWSMVLGLSLMMIVLGLAPSVSVLVKTPFPLLVQKGVGQMIYVRTQDTGAIETMQLPSLAGPAESGIMVAAPVRDVQQ